MKRLFLPAKLLAFLTTSVVVVVVFCFQNCSPVRFVASSVSDVTNQGDTSCTTDPSLCPPGVKTCSFNGHTYAEGQTITAYLNSSVPAGKTCVSETRKCTDGAFTGSYPYATCVINAPSSCLFNGRTISHGTSVTAYQSSNVPFGQNCVQEERTCNNGILSGSYNFATCTAGGPASCLFNGQTIAHGDKIKAYQNSSVTYGQSCQSEDRFCQNGVLSGTYNYSSCNPGAPSSCLFNGQTIAHGGTVTAFQNSSVPSGQACVSENRLCSNGALSGSYTFSQCAVNAPASCLFNGQTIAHGTSVIAFQASSVGYGQTCDSQVRTCNNGVLSGNYNFTSCSPGAPASCTFANQTVAHGQSVTAYSSSSVPYGSTCYAQTRTCNNGSLSGSYPYPSCTTSLAASCYFNGQTIGHGSSVTAYAASSVPFGQSCAAETRYCNNGILSGSYGASSCAAEPPPTSPKITVPPPTSPKITVPLRLFYMVSTNSQRSYSNSIACGSITIDTSDPNYVSKYYPVDYPYSCRQKMFGNRHPCGTFITAPPVYLWSLGVTELEIDEIPALCI